MSTATQRPSRYRRPRPWTTQLAIAQAFDIPPSMMPKGNRWANAEADYQAEFDRLLTPFAGSPKDTQS